MIPVVQAKAAVGTDPETQYIVRDLVWKDIIQTYPYIVPAFTANMIIIVKIGRAFKILCAAYAAQDFHHIHIILSRAQHTLLNITIIIQTVELCKYVWHKFVFVRKS